MLRVALILLLVAAPAAAQFRVPGGASPATSRTARGLARVQPAQPGGGSPGLQPRGPGSQPAPAPAARGPQLVDRIVAIVNKEVITQRDLNERVRLIEGQLKRQGTPLPAADVLERQVLERMISDRVQIQYARDTGVRADDVQVDRTVQTIAEENKMSLADFGRRSIGRGVVPEVPRRHPQRDPDPAAARARGGQQDPDRRERGRQFLQDAGRRRRGRRNSTSRTSSSASPRTRAPSRSSAPPARRGCARRACAAARTSARPR
jgi:hypothetical protein